MFTVEEANRQQLCLSKCADSDGCREAFADFLRWLSKCLLHADAPTKMLISLEVAYLLHDYATNESLWSWIGQQSAAADRDLRTAFKIAFLELLPEEPRDLQSLSNLWQLGVSKDTRWAVSAAYKNHAELRERDYDLVQKFRKQSGVEALPKLSEIVSGHTMSE